MCRLEQANVLGVVKLITIATRSHIHSRRKASKKVSIRLLTFLAGFDCHFCNRRKEEDVNYYYCMAVANRSGFGQTCFHD